MSQETEDQRGTKKVSRWIRFARYVTGIYFFTIAVFTILFVSVNKSWFSFNYELNQLGDFLTGVFAPIGFLWLVVGYLVQAEEFSTQAEELRNQTEQLRDEVEATKRLAELASLEATDKRNSVRPRFKFTFIENPEVAFAVGFRVTVQNLGAPTKTTSISGFSMNGEGKSAHAFHSFDYEQVESILTPPPSEGQPNGVVILVKSKTLLNEYLYFINVYAKERLSYSLDEPVAITEDEYWAVYDEANQRPTEFYQFAIKLLFARVRNSLDG